MAFTIRRAGPSDVDGIVACLVAAFDAFRKEYSPGAWNDTVLNAEGVRNRLKTMTMFVAVDETGAIIGSVAGTLASPREGHLRGMSVVPAYHGKGVAAPLLEAIEKEIGRQVGRGTITLETTTPLERASHFYRDHGYRASGKVDDYFGMKLFQYVKDWPPRPTTGVITPGALLK